MLDKAPRVGNWMKQESEEKGLPGKLSYCLRGFVVADWVALRKMPFFLYVHDRKRDDRPYG